MAESRTDVLPLQQRGQLWSQSAPGRLCKSDSRKKLPLCLSTGNIIGRGHRKEYPFCCPIYFFIHCFLSPAIFSPHKVLSLHLEQSHSTSPDSSANPIFLLPLPPASRDAFTFSFCQGNFWSDVFLFLPCRFPPSKFPVSNDSHLNQRDISSP